MSTTETIARLREKITTAESKTAAELEADRAKLAALEAEHEAAERAAQAAEAERIAARRVRWAEHYLAAEHDAETIATRKAERAARAAAVVALADAPWVRALVAWQEARDEAGAVLARYNYARRLTGQSTKPTPLRAEVLDRREGRVDLDNLGALIREAVLTTAAEPKPLAAVRALVDSDEELPGTSTPAGPVARLRRGGDTVESTEHDTDAGPVTMHRNLTTGAWVKTDQHGTILATSEDKPRPAQVEPDDEPDDEPEP